MQNALLARCYGRRWTSSRRVFAFQLGAAVKPSAIGSDKAEGLIKLARNLTENGYAYLVVDSERVSEDPSVEDVSAVLEACRVEGLCTPVFTVPVRRGDFRARFQAILKTMSNEGYGGLCLVAGNPAYLSGDELRIRAGPLILNAASHFREKAKNLPLFVGSENMVKTSRMAAQLYKATPLALLGPNLHKELALLSDGDGNFGVYTPFYVGEGCREAWEKLAAYIRRRNTGLGLEEAFRAYGLYGDFAYILERLRYLGHISVRWVVGYPLVPSEEQLALFAKVFGLSQGVRL